MKLKYRLYPRLPFLLRYGRKARKIAKKLEKYNDEEKYPYAWRNRWVAKKSWKFLKAMNIEIEVINKEYLPSSPAIIAPNHSSSMDPVVLICALNDKRTPEFKNEIKKHTFLVKSELKDNKRWVGYLKMLKSTFIDRNNPRDSYRGLKEFFSNVKSEHVYGIIFPEGTRSKDGNIQEFKSGAFKFAKKEFLPVVPVTINNSFGSTILDRKSKLKIQVIFHKSIKPQQMLTLSDDGIKEYVEHKVRKSWVEPMNKTLDDHERKIS